MNTVAEISLTYSTKVKPSDRPKIGSSKDAHAILIESWDQEQIELRESFKVLLMNRANRVLGIVNISDGGTCGTVADSKMIFSAAIKANASAIILCHNHPSGNLKPSSADDELTKKISEGGKLLDISVLDHIIIAPGTEYYSYGDEGRL